MKFLKIFVCVIVVAAFLFPTSSVDAAVAKKKAIVKVVAPKKKVVSKKVVQKISQRAAQLLIASASELRLSPGENTSIRFGFKNTGKIAWKSREIRLIAGGDGEIFVTSTWSASTTPVKISSEALKVGRLEFFDVALHAPDQPGKYVVKASLVVDGEVMPSGIITLPIEVIAPERAVIVSEQLLPEPRIRVALGKAEGAVSVRISAGNYLITLLDGTQIAPVHEGEKILLQYEPTEKMYLLTQNNVVTTSTQPFRLRADSSDGRFVLTDKNDAAQWNKKIVYNEYRDTFELRWSEKIPGVWMINELLIEHYLKGLVETGNSEPYELQKAVYTAARTYAYVYLPTGTYKVERTWDVHSVWDQVYKGYSAEVSNPNGVRAVDETRGILVTYEARPVITPYFTRSDGSTRGWKSVWGGTDKAWLQPVVASHDAGKKMWGHGVGMSTLDAKGRVQKDGWNFEQVLKYYYTGVQLRAVYR